MDRSTLWLAVFGVAANGFAVAVTVLGMAATGFAGSTLVGGERQQVDILQTVRRARAFAVQAPETYGNAESQKPAKAGKPQSIERRG